jgi:N-methylhydantoinase A
VGAILGIDVGGTFTDFIEIGADGGVAIAKSSSTPDNPADAVLAGLAKLAGRRGTLADYLKNLDLIVHGTTITTNAVITGRYSKTGFVTTAGLKDILNSRRGLKRNAFTAREAPPTPIVPQRLIRTVDERLDKTGAVLRALSHADVETAADHFKAEGVEAIAVCYMFSFLNPEHERETQRLLERRLPGVYVTVSSSVLPQVRLYERASTTVFNACVGPLLRSYIDDLQRQLGEAGFHGRLLTMQSNGGLMSPEMVKDFAANTLLSGPASGPVAGHFFARRHGLRDLITIDMGGTSLDACLVREGEAALTKHSEVAEYALAVPSLAINAIGAGGGSIASVGAGGLLRVGPESAGAEPGPAAYGLGGDRPTVTDANIVLRYINPDYFLGGERQLDVNRSRAALDRDVGKPLGLSTVAAALGVVRMVDSQMANAVRAVSVARGFDPRDACLVVGGGAGPLHGCGIADELDMSLVLVPATASVLCATGMLATNLRQDLQQYAKIPLANAEVAAERLRAICQDLVKRGHELLDQQKVPENRRRLEFSCDMQFAGQFNVLETRVAWLDRADIGVGGIAAVRKIFERNHDRVYGYVLEGELVEIQSVRVAVIGVTEDPPFRPIAIAARSDASAAIKDRRRIWFAEDPLLAPVYDGAKLRAGHEISGPAIVEQPTTTIKVPPHWNAKVDEIGSLILWTDADDLDLIMARLRRGPSVPEEAVLERG